jgi:hypothetical protein
MLKMINFRFAALFALLLLTEVGVSQSQAQTSTHSFTSGTNSGTVSSSSSALLFTPDEAVYLESFSYLGTDGTTALADDQLFYVALPVDNYSENGFSFTEEQIDSGLADIRVDSGATIIGGSWDFTSVPLLLTPDYSYLFITGGSVENVGIGESGDGLNGGLIWLGLAVQGTSYFNYSFVVTAVPEPATGSILAGMAVLGLSVLRRRPSRRS